MRPSEISEQCTSLLDHVENAPNISTTVKKDMVLFIDRLVEVVEQAFREILRLSIELKHIQDSDLTPDGIRRLKMKTETLQQRDRYRDVELICGRLHVLRTQFHDEGFDSLTQGFDSSFRELVYLIDDRENHLVRVAEDFLQFVYSLLNDLQRSVNDTSKVRQVRDDISATISVKIPELQESLHALHEIHNRILPTLGGAGLVEILSGRQALPSVSIDASRQFHIYSFALFVSYSSHALR